MNATNRVVHRRLSSTIMPRALKPAAELLRQQLGPDGARRTLQRRLEGLIQRGQLAAVLG